MNCPSFDLWVEVAFYDEEIMIHSFWNLYSINFQFFNNEVLIDTFSDTILYNRIEKTITILKQKYFRNSYFQPFTKIYFDKFADKKRKKKRRGVMNRYYDQWSKIVQQTPPWSKTWKFSILHMYVYEQNFHLTI